MRPAIYGRQIVLSRNGKLAGINIGYNNYAEHDRGMGEVLNSINQSMLSFTGMAKAYRKDVKLIRKGRYRSTPFADSILFPHACYLRREIRIDNSDLATSGFQFLLRDSEYTLLFFSDASSVVHFNKSRIENKRKFNEAHFFYMPDYRDVRRLEYQPFAGAWASDGFILLIEKTGSCISFADEIESSLKEGSLALVGSEHRLFKDRGLSLILLNNAYSYS